MLRRLSLIIVALLLFVAGVEAKGREVAVEGVERVTHLSSSGMNLWLDVRNERCSRLVLKRCEVEISVGGVARATISLRDKVVVRGRSDGSVLVPLRFKCRSSLALVSLLRKVVEDGAEEITISYRLRGGTALFKRSVVGEDIPVREVIEMLGLEQGILMEIRELLLSL